MRSNFTLKIALSNLGKNRKFYLPYILASTIMISIFYIMGFLVGNKGLNNFRGTESVQLLLMLGTIIVGIFSLIFIFYINNFLMKQRSKEFGLYNMLGMEKVHLGRVLFAESLITSAVSIGSGIGVGVLFSKLTLMIMGKVMGIGTPLDFEVSIMSIKVTSILFLAFFAAVLMKNIVSISLSKPVEMLKGASEPEREPKARWILSIIGSVCMIAGYVISIRIKYPLAALVLFFFAVVLVIIGTYLLFTTISISLLKLMKRNKRLYYRKNNFTTISGMLFRMKQNAVGMANICILSTMVIIIISVSISLKVGIDTVIDKVTPNDLVMSMSLNSEGENSGEFPHLSNKTMDKEKEVIKEKLRKLNVESKNEKAFLMHSFEVNYDKKLQSLNFKTVGMHQYLNVISAEQYRRYTGEKLNIESDEAISIGTNLSSKVNIAGKDFKIKRMNLKNLPSNISPIFDEYTLVVKDEKTIEKFAEKANKEGYYKGMQFYITADFTKVVGQDYNRFDKLLGDYMEERSKTLNLSMGSMATRSEISALFKGMTNGFLFLGIFLGIVFTFAAALIVYYKQISEGYYDKDKFEIMQKVGMSERDVKQSIRKQIMIVFFAPLLIALCHVAGAFNMIRLMLRLLAVDNLKLLIECTAVSALGFALIYALVFVFTAREYYQIVRRRI